MEITAKTKEGFLIQATESEVNNILTAVLGIRVKNIEIGQKIPAMDYATTVTKIKKLRDSYKFQNLFSNLDTFNKAAEGLREAVMTASDIES